MFFILKSEKKTLTNQPSKTRSPRKQLELQLIFNLCDQGKIINNFPIYLP